MPSGTQTLRGVSKVLPVKVTTRLTIGSPSITARLIAYSDPTFCTRIPISAGIPPAGTSLFVRTLISCFSPPEGYLVGITRITMSLFCAADSRALIASGLLSSIPMMVSLGCKMCSTISIPCRTSSACSCKSLSSAVMYGSHSAALTIKISVRPKPDWIFFAVGKPAPPIPEMPAMRITSKR